MKRLGRPPKSLAKIKPQPTLIETVSSRIGGRERKVKKVFDPSENNTPKKRAKTSQSMERSTAEFPDYKYKSSSDTKSISPKAKCSGDEFCLICNKEEKKLKTLANCNDCNVKVHIECLKTKFEDKKLLITKWRCDNCRTCAICYETEEIGALITCSICINSYHIACHIPKVNTKLVSLQDWRCTKCPLKILKKKPNNEMSIKATILKPHSTSIGHSNSSSNSEKSISSSSSIATSRKVFKNRRSTITAPTVTIKEETLESSNYDIKQYNDTKPMQKSDPNDVPDISSWSREKLADFMDKIFPFEAQLLREQDVDGQSLLLMTRTDVLALGLRLGPALRLFNFIVGLQTRKYDNFATWIY